MSVNREFLNYEGRNTIRGVPSQIFQGPQGGCRYFCSYTNSQDTCCLDTWKNVWVGPEDLPFRRECTPEEQNKLSMRKILVKQMISLMLLGLIGVYILLVSEQERGIIFNCDLADPDSIPSVDGFDGTFVGVYCNFKSIIILLSFIFLIPFYLETVSILTIIFVSSINDEVLIPIAEGEYAGYDTLFNGVMDTNPFTRMYYSFAVFCRLPFQIISIASESGSNASSLILIPEILWKFVVFMLPDLAVAVALFPVSYFVLQSSTSPDELLVNLVAVQIFAQLDEVLVKMTFRPRDSVGDAVMNYVVDNGESKVAEYKPLEVFRLNANRHEMGLRSRDPQQQEMMHNFHEYKGFPLV